MPERKLVRQIPAFVAILCLILATIHVTQGIWRSGWDDFPGGLGDGRLNNFLLEHGYQSVLGNSNFLSPGQFAPVEETIAYSVMHIGNLPLYAVWRSIGVSIETSFQLWMVSTSVLNGAAFLILLRALRIPWILAGPLVFLGTSPASIVAMVGTHVQVFPFFAFAFALRQWVLFINDWRVERLVWAMGFMALQHLCSPYLGFFTAVATVFGLSFSAIAFREGVRSGLKIECRFSQNFFWGAAFLFVAGLLAAWMYWLYLGRVSGNGGREWKSLILLAPHWKLWAFNPAEHWLYGDLFTKGKSINETEHALFSGVVPWLALVAAVLHLAFRKGDRLETRWLFVFTCTGIGLILFFTAWNESGSGVFLWLSKRIDAFTAYRASSRSILVIHLFQVIALSVLVSVWYRSAESLAGKSLTIGLVAFAALEGVSLQQWSIAKAYAIKRSEAVLEAWREAGDRPVLVFAPGLFNGSATDAHMDAWSAAIRTQRKTSNGYSGGVPSSHGTFLLKPTRENAESMLNHLGVDPGMYSIVESWGDREGELGIERFEFDPLKRLDRFGIQPTWWNYFFPVGRFAFEGLVIYEFSPIMSARFELPDGAKRVSMILGLREGAYTGNGISDGVGVRWSIVSDGEIELVNELYLNPRDNVEHRGYNPYGFDIPTGENRELLLEVDGGPQKNTAFDWFMIGELNAE